MNPWLGMALVLGALGATLGGLKWAQARFGMHPEWARKGLHVAMAAVTLPFPFLFHERWPVLVLAVLSVGLMLAVRYVGVLRAQVGGVIHGVERDSFGEVYYPLAVCALFVLAADRPVLYAIPLLLLGLADPAAALIGLRHGMISYTTPDGRKSREGSVAFFAVAFLCVHVPLLLLTDTGRAESLLVACIVGLIVMLLEAVAWKGLDNLFIPLGAFVLLDRLLRLSEAALVAHLVVLVAFAAVAALWRRETTLGGSAVPGAVLVGYVTWALGGWAWLLAPAVFFFTYTRLWPRTYAPGAERAHTVHTVLSVASVGFFWLLAAALLGQPRLIVPYALAYAANLALIGVERQRSVAPPEGRRPRRARRVWAAAVLHSAVPLALVLAFLSGVEGMRGPRLAWALLVYGLLALAAAGLAARVFFRFRRQIEASPSQFVVRVRRAGIVAAASALGLLAPLFFRGEGPWRRAGAESQRPRVEEPLSRSRDTLLLR